MSFSNFHSHSNFCDGNSPMEQYVLEAIHQKFSAYGFSSHSPIPFHSEWSMNIEKLADYMLEFSKLKQKYANQIELYLSLEIDYIPKYSFPKSDILKTINLDYTIGSVHFIDFINEQTPWEIDGPNNKFEKGFSEIFDRNIDKVISRYYELTREMVLNAPPTIVGHLDKLKIQNHYQTYFDEHSELYQNEVLKTLDVIQKSRCFIEVNTRGLYKGKSLEPYPSVWILKAILERNIPIVLNSDAHVPREISLQFGEITELLKSIGFKTKKTLKKGVWINEYL